MRKQPVEYSRLDGAARRSMLNLYCRMVALLVKQGFPARLPYQPPEEYAALISPRIQDGREIVERLTGLANRAAYDPEPFADNVREVRQSLVVLRTALSVHR